MQVSINEYLQMVIQLSEKDLTELGETGKIDGHGYYYPIHENVGQSEIDSKLYLRDEGWKTEIVPGILTLKDNYEIGMPPEGLRILKEGKPIGSQFPTITFRSVYISREDILLI